MKTTKTRLRTRRSLAYHEIWRGQEPVAAPTSPESYWHGTTRPIPCLVFTLPFVIAYESGVRFLGGASADTLRTGADSWIRRSLAMVSLSDAWLPPIALIAALLAWQAFRPGTWKFRVRWLAGMAVEALLFAIVLVGLSRVVELGFDRLDGHSLLATTSRTRLAGVVGFIGAGVYEEALFRLALVPVIYFGARSVYVPKLPAGTLAITGSALLFSLAHHAGAPGEAFTLYAFIFRWLAGILFAWIFLVRGFGVAVGAHVAYDVLVGYVGMHF